MALREPRESSELRSQAEAETRAFEAASRHGDQMAVSGNLGS